VFFFLESGAPRGSLRRRFHIAFDLDAVGIEAPEGDVLEVATGDGAKGSRCLEGGKGGVGAKGSLWLTGRRGGEAAKGSLWLTGRGGGAKGSFCSIGGGGAKGSTCSA
jgi:hypothetical protein